MQTDLDLHYPLVQFTPSEDSSDVERTRTVLQMPRLIWAFYVPAQSDIWLVITSDKASFSNEKY